MFRKIFLITLLVATPAPALAQNLPDACYRRQLRYYSCPAQIMAINTAQTYLQSGFHSDPLFPGSTQTVQLEGVTLYSRPFSDSDAIEGRGRGFLIIGTGIQNSTNGEQWQLVGFENNQFGWYRF